MYNNLYTLKKYRRPRFMTSLYVCLLTRWPKLPVSHVIEFIVSYTRPTDTRGSKRKNGYVDVGREKEGISKDR